MLMFGLTPAGLYAAVLQTWGIASKAQLVKTVMYTSAQITQTPEPVATGSVDCPMSTERVKSERWLLTN